MRTTIPTTRASSTPSTRSVSAPSSARRSSSSQAQVLPGGRLLIHEPLEGEGRRADDEKRRPREVVVAPAVEHQAAHPGAEERADLVAEEHHAVEHVEVRQAEHAPDDAADER